MILEFDKGTLILRGANHHIASGMQSFKWDERTQNFRAPAYHYRRILRQIQDEKIDLKNCAYQLPENDPKCVEWRCDLGLFPYQMAACDIWEEGGCKGIIVLPTGAGKTRVAFEIIKRQMTSTLVLVPTRALLQQWKTNLSQLCHSKIGMIGDGYHELQTITICTFESAYRRMTQLGNRFELLIVDEAHHFGCGLRDETLLMSIATKRLALTASLPIDIAHRSRLEAMVGPLVFERGIEDLRGKYLADFDHFRVPVRLTEQESLEYQASYSCYLQFTRESKWCWQELGWQAFSRYACQSEKGRKALESARRARSIVSFCQRKRDLLKSLVQKHWQQRIFVFVASTQDACEVARQYLAYPITAAVGRAEREMILQKFREGTLRSLVACKVLNEGIDVPEADVAIILGGTGSPREQIQRVGRVLRKGIDKRAMIYELIAEQTFEIAKSNRRNKHTGK